MFVWHMVLSVLRRGTFGGAIFHGDNFLTNRIDGNFRTLFAHSEQRHQAATGGAGRNQFH